MGTWSWVPNFQTNTYAEIIWQTIASGKHTKNYGKSQCLIGKSAVSTAIFNSKLLVYQRVAIGHQLTWPKIGGLLVAYVVMSVSKSIAYSEILTIQSPNIVMEKIWLVVWNMILFSISLGMSSSQLTSTPSFFRGVGKNHQAVNQCPEKTHGFPTGKSSSCPAWFCWFSHEFIHSFSMFKRFDCRRVQHMFWKIIIILYMAGII